MPSYVSRPVQVEAMQWNGDQLGLTSSGYVGLKHAPPDSYPAEAIIKWVNANGGEALYKPASGPSGPGEGSYDGHPARIAVRTINDWEYMLPGWWAVPGYEFARVRFPLHGGGAHWEEVRSFRVVAELSDLPIKHEWTLKEQTTRVECGGDGCQGCSSCLSTSNESTDQEATDV